MYGPIPYPQVFSTGKTVELVRQGVMSLGNGQIQSLKSLYRGEISYMDAYLSAVRERLKERGLEDNTLVVFLSDHGEEIADHRRFGHRYTLYEEVLRVPLVFSLKDVIPAGKRVERPVELVDVAPTILDLIDEPIPEVMQGRSLLPDLFSDEQLSFEQPVFADLDDEHLSSVVFGQWKLIRMLNAQAGLENYQLFDLANDPEEKVNLWTQQPVAGPALRQMLLQQDIRNSLIKVSDPVQLERKKIDPAVRRDLEALGYL